MNSIGSIGRIEQEILNEIKLNPNFFKEQCFDIKKLVDVPYSHLDDEQLDKFKDDVYFNWTNCRLYRKPWSIEKVKRFEKYINWYQFAKYQQNISDELYKLYENKLEKFL
jgi:hypothetical protein